MNRFAVIDTETTWDDAVMSIGIVVANANTFEVIDKKYYILTPYKNQGGMYTAALYAGGTIPDLEGSRETALNDLLCFLATHKVDTIFAYNASFDYQHLPELRQHKWFDIMKLAAYRQYNPRIPSYADCYGTGRLKRGYGVESIYRMLSDDFEYCELHNALTDAMDELEIMRLLNLELDCYGWARIK
ncbi:hypothetical protein HCH52_09555 [Oscillospiraceae bacterium HV4-5-C5C]|nr:hypothetical protein [Oscillospiraceae bacterium HV4-5-C5C]